jgi:L-aminopeptidase/D-esterase-like protein
VITDVPGVRVGHWQDLQALTGCTVILPPPMTTGSVFIPGLAPATRETDAIAPGRRVQYVNAILLTGGSAFGLGAANGVMTFLEERDIGHQTPAGVVPIVPTAAIFDLLVGDAARRPTPDDAYQACLAAASETLEGNVGVGAGATVGKAAGFENMSKGGLGTASVTVGDVVVGALVVVNAVGDVVEEDGTVIAGARGAPMQMPPPGTATTLACVATNALLDKEECLAAATIAAQGLGRAIRPVHTMFDGDVVFMLATGAVASSVTDVGRAGADVIAHAVRRAVRAATSIDGVPALGRPGGIDENA